MKHSIHLLLASAAVCLPLSLAHAADPVSDADKAFVAMVSQGGMFEVKLGQLAGTQGAAQDIRDQGLTEAHDHQLVGDKLKAIATEAGLPFPDALNAEFQQQLDRLKALQGATFDNAYVAAMKNIHAKDGAAFAKEATSGSNPKLKAFAAETHSIVVMHIGELKAVPTEK